MAKPALANDFNHACRYVALPRCAVNFFVILATIRASAWKLALPEISILLLLDFHQNLGASGDQAVPLARPLIEKHHALAEQKRIKKHGTSVRIPR
jgi:hypothetical protein